MSIKITSAMASGYIQNNITKTTNAYNKAMDQLASGSQITDVADDPVGVTKIRKLNIQLLSANVASSNIATGQDLLALAEENQSLIIDNLQRINDLTLQAANGTYDSLDKDAILAEIRARLDQVNVLADSVSYNDIKLLDGSSSNLILQIGINPTNSSLNVGAGLIDTHTSALGVDIDPAITGATWSQSDMLNYVVHLNDAISTLIDSSSLIGSSISRLDYSQNTIGSINESLTETRSQISDTDVAETSAEIVRTQIVQQASLSMLVQCNQMPDTVISMLIR